MGMALRRKGPWVKAPERPFSDSLQSQPKEELSSGENLSMGQQASWRTCRLGMGGSCRKTSPRVEWRVGGVDAS